MGRALHRKICYSLTLLILLASWGPGVGGQEEKGISARIEEGEREFSQMTCQGLERAIEHFRRVSSLQPDSPLAHAWLGRAYGHLGAILQREGKGGADLLARGMTHARRAYELAPRSVDSCLAMADLYLLTSNFSEAWKMAEAARKIDPQNPWAAYFLWKASEPENPESPILQGALSGKLALTLAFLDQGHAFRRMGQREKATQAYLEATQQSPPLAQAHFALASLCEEEGDGNLAISEYQKGLKIEDRLSLPHKALAQLLRERGRNQEAIQAYQKAIELNRNDFDAYLGLAKSHQAMRSYEEALSAFRQSLELNPQLPEAYHVMGEIAEIQGDPEQAILHYGKAIDLGLNLLFLHEEVGLLQYQQGRHAEAEAALRKAKELRSQRPAVYNALGEIYQRKAAWEESVSAYSQAIALNPNLASAHANLGSIYGQRGEWEKALEAYEKAIDLDSQMKEALRSRMAEACSGIGHELWKAGREEEALKRLKEALSLEPGRISDLKAMAQICYEQGRPEAERYLAAALSLDPNWGEAYLALADLYLKQGKGKEAMSSLEKAVSLFPQRAELHHHLGLLYQEDGQVERAASELGKAVELDPQMTSAWARLGDLYLGRGAWEEAIKSYDAAIRRNGDLARTLKDRLFQAHVQMALSFHQQGRLDEAQVHYLKALSLRGSEAALLYNLGNLYRERGELGKAEEAYRSTLKADAGWAKAHLVLALLAEGRKDWQTALSEWGLYLEGEPQSEIASQVEERIAKISAALKRR